MRRCQLIAIAPRSRARAGSATLGRRAGAVGGRHGRRGAAPALLEEAHETLAPRAVEEHVEPGESEVGAGLVAAARHGVDAQQLAALRAPHLVEPAEEQLGHRRAGRADAGCTSKAGQPSLARGVEPVDRRADAERAADRRAQDRVRARRVGEHARGRRPRRSRGRAAARAAPGGWRRSCAACRRRRRAGSRRRR